MKKKKQSTFWAINKLFHKYDSKMMVDLSLHPRYQRFLVGHAEVQSVLAQAMELDRLPHAWIFSGMQGIGKATCAYQFARKLFKQSDFDGKLIDRQVDAGTYPNLLVVERGVNEDGKLKNEIVVDDTRAVRSFLQQSAAMPGWRVIIVDAVDDLNRNAANSLLKSLEEPPSKTVFLLISHALGHVLPTIRSRCQSLHFLPLSSEEFEKAQLPDIGSLALTMAGGSFGKYNQLINVDCEKILQTLLGLIPLILQDNFTQAQNYATSFPKADPKFPVILDIIEWMVAQFVKVGHLSDIVDQRLLSVGRSKSSYYWVYVYQQISAFLSKARYSHLDQTHLLMTVFFIIHNPELGEQFAHG